MITSDTITEPLYPELEFRRGNLQQADLDLNDLHYELLEKSYQAGMVEFAATVLEKVGNILNSINVSSSLIAERVRNSHIRGLNHAVEMLQSHQNDLGDFFAADPKAHQLPGFLYRLSGHVSEEHQEIIDELAFLTDNIRQIRELVARQKSAVLPADAGERMVNGNVNE